MVWPDLGQFHFLRPWWLLALLVALAMAAYALRAQRLSSRWETFIDPDLREAMIEHATRRRSRLIPILTFIGLALASLALAGPTWQRLPQPVQQRTDALVIVLDLSLSMYAQDVPPSRLVQARHAITDILRRRSEGFTGLIAYAGDAHTVAPLTDDVGTIENMLAALAPDMMPQLGSNPGPALELARGLFANAGLNQGRILLVTDGIDRISDVTAFASVDFPISILGIGTRAGAAIPLDFNDQPGRQLTDRQGNAIIATLDVDRLTEVARMCFGRYATVNRSDTNLDALLSSPLPRADDERRVDREFDLWADYGYWLAALAMPLALMLFRRGAVALLLCALLPPPAHASWWDDLWQRPDQQAMHALRDGEPERAATLFKQPQWQGVAQYRGADYVAAGKNFASDASAAGHYNQGNALAQQGRLPDAIAAYDQALQISPDDADAAFNKALLEKLLQQQQQASKGDNQESQSNRNPSDAEQSREQQSKNDDSAQQSKPQDGRPDQQPQSTEQNADKRKPESEKSEAQQLAERDDQPRDEQRDALEQWLRRVPDDPAGLLRRKFQYETNQRRRQGESSGRDSERIW